jgi:methanogenic corrinoid protein MtbC1
LISFYNKKLIRGTSHKNHTYWRKKEGIYMSWLKSMVEKEPPEPTNPIGIVVIGTLEPDMHLTPKEMVRKALKSAQFKCIDVGRKASALSFAQKAVENNAQIIAVSVNTGPAKSNIPALMSAIEAAGLKGKVTIMIGGAAVDQSDAASIGALFGATKDEAVVLAKKAIGQ